MKKNVTPVRFGWKNKPNYIFHPLLSFLLLAFYIPLSIKAQAPNISYSGVAASYPLNVALSLSPTNSGGAISDLSNAVTTFAGSGTTGSTDATGTAASFYNPYGVAVDGSGNVYVADYRNNKIRKITAAGVVTTLAGSGTQGSTDATGTAASFFFPHSVAVDGSGNVYVADYANHKIRKITADGVVTTLAGSGAIGSTDATGTAASFYYPSSVAVDGSGNVYVADYYNYKIRKITAAGVVTTLAGSGAIGSTDATGTAASFRLPTGVAVDGSGNVYVADYDDHKIRKITAAGVVTTLAGSGTAGSTDATGTAAKFNNPYGVAVDGSGNVYVADYTNHKIRKITAAGVVTTLAGSTQGSTDATGTAAKFSLPIGVAVDGSGNVYVADTYNNKIRKIAPFGYSISPALPTGLSMNASGVISGTPTVIAASTTYTITGVNLAGSSTTTITFGVGEPDYVISNIGGALVITDRVGNGETLEVTQNGTNINFNATGRTYALNGGTPTAMPVDIPKAGLTSIVINTAGGNDIIKFSNYITAMPSLTVNGGAGDDLVYSIGGGITLLANANLDLDLTNDASVGDKDEILMEPVSNDILSFFTLSGTGSAVVKVSKSVSLGVRSSITTQQGNLSVEANWNSATVGSFSGISLPNLSLLGISGTGQLTVRGKGGDTGANNNGIFVSGGSIRGGTTGTTLAEGIGGASSGDTNQGIYSGNLAGGVTTLGSDLVVNGTGGGISTSATNYGVIAGPSGGINAGGTGVLTLTGTGGSSSGANNIGVMAIGSIGLQTSGGNIVINGTKGANSTAVDILVTNTGGISGRESITVNSTTGGFSPNNVGITFRNTSTTKTTTFATGSKFNYYVGGATRVGATAGQYHPLQVVGLIDLNNVDLVTSGSYVPVATNEFPVVLNDGTDAVIGKFKYNGVVLNEGSQLPNFRGSSVTFCITYSGGDGNDVVIRLPIVYTWTGNTSTDWSTATNWTPNSVPTSIDKIIIPNTANAPQLPATLTLAIMELMGDNKILLGNTNLTVGSITGANSTNFIVTNGTGSLTITNVGTTPQTFPVGPSATEYTPVTISNNVARDFTVKVATTLTSPVANFKYVNMQWNITPSVMTGNSSTLALGWSAAHQAVGFNPAAATQINHYNTTTSTWDVSYNATVSGSNPYLATATGITAFSPFSISNTPSAVLAVELVYFRGRNTEGGNLLTWKTANEENNKGFNVERLMDNGQWAILGFVNAQGKGATYEFTDKNPFTTSYYRLRQIDNDGKETLSKVVSVGNTDKTMLKVYPSVSTSILTIETSKMGDYKVFNLLGQQILSGKTTPQIDVSALPKGTYFLKVGDEQVKFVKQ